VVQRISRFAGRRILPWHHNWRKIAISVRRDSAAKLVDGLAGESPASADYPVGTVVISGDGAGDQTVGSPDVNVLVGRTEVWSAPTGGQAKQQVVAKANRSQALENAHLTRIGV
jgi:hypothetical protein